MRTNNWIYILFLAFCFSAQLSRAQWDGNTTPTYPELIAYYQKLDKEHKEIELYNMGSSDYGLPIYLCLINAAQDSVRSFEKARKGTTVLINNAIHAGEPDGVNACLIWIDNWIKRGKKTRELPVVAIIPAYNVGGMMNRNSFSRANQNGPEEYGFRGNAQNLDLNRDFIKMDSRNAFTFSRIFTALEPDVFVDTHVSNGADYQYTLTYISSLKERMAPSIRNITYERVIPAMEADLNKKKWDLFPYVELVKGIPEEGIHAFNDLPRYAMGYAALFDAISFTVETHMLKPFPARVAATQAFLSELISWSGKHGEEIENAKKEAVEFWKEENYFKCKYELIEKKDSILFKGYTPIYPVSKVTGLPQLKYDQNAPYEKYIPWFGTYVARDSVKVPEYFIVGGQCRKVIERLLANGVQMTILNADTVLSVQQERVSSFKSMSKPWEGHFYHQEVNSSLEEKEVGFKKGDVLIPLNQYARNLILSVLLTSAEDSYFRWNFFDSYLQQKEYFSPYVFEEKALEILEKRPELRQELELLRSQSIEFRESEWEQLYFIYKNSEYFEESFYLLPVFMKNGVWSN